MKVRFNKRTPDEAVYQGPVVVYCSMARESWLQPAGEIGNPYHGRSMEKCGEVVEK